MDYSELAQQMMQNLENLSRHKPQKNMNEAMRGEPFMLQFLLRKGGLALPSEISNEMNITTARIAVALNSLEEKGRIVREIDKTDRRKILVTLTEEGMRVAKEEQKQVLEHMTTILEALGEHDAEEFVRIIGKLSKLDCIKDVKCSGTAE